MIYYFIISVIIINITLYKYLSSYPIKRNITKELIAGLIIIDIYFLFNIELIIFPTVLTFSLLYLLILFDIYDNHQVPDSINILSFTASMFIPLINQDFDTIKYSFMVIGIFTFLWYVSSYILKREAFGLGDLLFFGIYVNFLNYEEFLYAIIIASMSAVPFSIYNLKKNNNSELPFFPFLLLGLTVLYIIK